jgi:hypothetical protein
MDLLRRLAAAPRSLGSDQQLAGLAAVALLLSMFLPWYEKSVVDPRSRRFVNDAVSAFGTISFVEAAVFLVAAGVLALLFTRAERREYELPGGDGTVIMAAGLWAAALIFWRVFDKPNVSGDGSTVGIQWGFFVAFVSAGALASSGWRMRQHERASKQPPPPRTPRPPREPRPDPEPDEEPTLPVRREPDTTPDRLF